MGGETDAPTIPNCRSLSLLGERSASTLYAADSDRFGGAVTITVYSPPGDDRARQRFEAAVATARRLGAHPNLVTIHANGQTADGRPYVISDGRDRTTAEGVVATSGAMGVEPALRIGVALAGALETAHRAGIVHGGIAPNLVLLRGDGQPVLTEVGLSSFGQPVSATAALARWIPYHAPPEVLEDTELSVATDVYSLASVVYMLLTGRPPHAGSGADDSTASLLLRILQLPVPVIDRSDVPRALDEALRTALTHNPAKRLQSALELAWVFQDAQRTAGFAVTEPALLDLAPGTADDAPDESQGADWSWLTSTAPTSGSPAPAAPPAPTPAAPPTPTPPTPTPPSAPTPPTPTPPSVPTPRVPPSAPTPPIQPAPPLPVRADVGPGVAAGAAGTPLGPTGPATPSPINGHTAFNGTAAFPPAGADPQVDRGSHTGLPGTGLPGTGLPGTGQPSAAEPPDFTPWWASLPNGDAADPRNGTGPLVLPWLPQTSSRAPDEVDLGPLHRPAILPSEQALHQPLPPAERPPIDTSRLADPFGPARPTLPAGPDPGHGFTAHRPPLPTRPVDRHAAAGRDGGAGDWGGARPAIPALPQARQAPADNGPGAGGWPVTSGSSVFGPDRVTDRSDRSDRDDDADDERRPPVPFERPALGPGTPDGDDRTGSTLARARQARLDRQLREGAPDVRPSAAPASAPRRPLGATPDRVTRRTGPPALPVIVLVAVVVVLGLGGAWMVLTGEDGPDPASDTPAGAPPSSPTTQGAVAPGGATDLTAVEAEGGVQLDWGGPAGTGYLVRVLTPTAPPRVLPAGQATALLVPADTLQPGAPYCFDVIAVPAGGGSSVTTEPTCIRGAAPDSVIRD